MSEQPTYRYDSGNLRSAVRTKSGYILAEGYAARPGILIYQDAKGGTRRELVTKETLSNVDSLASLARMPVTLGHPVDGMVTPDNVGEHAVGDIDGIVETDALNGFVRVRLAVRRADAIKAIDSGITQLSCGYTVNLDETPGNDPEFGPYDAIQENRSYNHISITPYGRAGADVSLRADSSDAFQITPQQEEIMSDEKVKTAVETALKNRKDAEDSEALKAEIDTLKAEIEELTKAPAAPEPDDEVTQEKTDAAFMVAFKERADALNVAKLARVDGADIMPVADIKRAVVKNHLGENMRADATDAYIEAAYDMAKIALAKQKQHSTYNPAPRADADQEPAISAEQAFRNNLQNQLKRG